MVDGFLGVEHLFLLWKSDGVHGLGYLAKEMIPKGTALTLTAPDSNHVLTQGVSIPCAH